MPRIAHLFHQINKFIYLLLSIDEDDDGTNQSSIAERRDEIANHIIVSPQLHSHHHHHRHLWTVPWTRRVAMSKKTLAGKLEEQKPMKFPTFIGTWPYCVSELLLRLFGRYEMQPGLTWSSTQYLQQPSLSLSWSANLVSFHASRVELATDLLLWLFNHMCQICNFN